MRKWMAVEKLESLVARGRREGWLHPYIPADMDPWVCAQRTWQGDFAGLCQNPQHCELHARVSADAKRERVPPLRVWLKTRCRRCEPCVKGRRMFWMDRAVAEYHRARVTWMGTLTVRPEEHYLADCRLALRLADEGVEIGSLSERELFQQRTQELGKEVTLWLKRVREAILERSEERPVLRYLIVAERHLKDPESAVYLRPHFHLLLHQQPGSVPLFAAHEHFRAFDEEAGREVEFANDKSLVRAQWKLGWSRFVLCEGDRGCWYVCKYVADEMASRPRASILYGLDFRKKIQPLSVERSETSGSPEETTGTVDPKRSAA